MSREDVTDAPGEKPSVGAQKGGSPNDGSQTKTLAIIIPLALIGTNCFVLFFCNVMKLLMYKNVWRKDKQKAPESYTSDLQALIDVINLIENSTLSSVKEHLNDRGPKLEDSNTAATAREENRFTMPIREAL